MEDGREVGTPMNMQNAIGNIAVSRHGQQWVVGGTNIGQVMVWNAESHAKVTEFQAHRGWVYAVDVSPGATRIATGSDDGTACVWSLSTGERLLDPLKHNYWVVAVKFSPDGRLIATATAGYSDLRVYDCQNGSLLVKFPVEVYPTLNQSLAWASDSKKLFALSQDDYIYHIDVSTKTTISQWHIRSSHYVRCIALASNDSFIAASARSSVSLWNTTTQQQIGSIEYTHPVLSIAMSSNHNLVTSGNKKITILALCSILPSYYFDNVSVPTF